MAAKLLGAHMPTSGGLGNALRRGKEIGCTAVQVFTSSPQMWRASTVTPEKVADFRKAQKETGITEVVSHDSYLINLCAPDADLRAKSFNGLKGEMDRCARYGIKYVVSHMGACVGQTEDQALKGVARAAMALLEETDTSVTLCMETTAGQGSALNHRFEHLATIIEACKAHPRLAVCMDTCHLFAAGYDIREPDSYSRTMEEFGRIIGFDRLKVVHCNDSKKPLGSRVDRHEHIGKGLIGEKAFELLVNDKRLAKVPILLETPEAPEKHKMNLDRLWSLVHRKK